ncbi:MAG TPA: hypothetical protein VFE61_03445 [Candidatus Sulfotelmatobacter sp.]|nr:hypothetical protein [Candidatus Sulfotelmatobacter sp.]
MRRPIIFLVLSLVTSLVLAAKGFAQSGLQVQNSHTTESLRGVSVVSREIAWASGTHGTYLRTTDGGRTWTSGQVPDAGTLDFRGVAAFSSDDAFLMSSGAGEQSRIYHTRDAGRHWALQLLNADPKGFFDSIAFWDATHGVVVGDPVLDDAGTLKFEILLTEDGQNWRRVSATPLPAATEGEGAFAASNTCIAIIPGGSDSNIWFATGGKVARVFHSADRGKSWQVSDTPIVHGPESAGIFSIAFQDAMHGVIAGGNYKLPSEDGANLAFTDDGGKTWTLSGIHPQVFFSAAVYDRKASEETHGVHRNAENTGKKTAVKTVPSPRLFLVGQDFVSAFRPAKDLRHISPEKGSEMKFNAASAYPGGGALVVGAKGAVAVVP